MSLRTRYYRPRTERQRQTTAKPTSRNAPTWYAAITSATVSGSDLTLVFDRPVVLRASDQPTGILTDIAVTEVSAAQTAEDTIVITYSGSVAAATEVILPNPPSNAVRNVDGGFVASLTFPVTT